MFSKFISQIENALDYLDDKVSQIVEQEKSPKDIVNATNHAVTRIDEEIHSIFFANMRNEHLNLISPDLEEDRTAVEQVNAKLKLASISLLCAFGSLVYTPFIIISLSSIIFYAFELTQTSVQYLRKGKIRKEITVALLCVGCIVTWQILSLAIGIFIFVLGEKFSIHLQNNSKKKLVNIFQIPIDNVWVLVEDQEIQIPFSQLQIGDTIILQAGEVIPIDGVITQGYGLIDQHALTGESQPAEKNIGDTVLASTTMIMGKIYVHVEKTGNDITASKIQKTLIETTSYISNIQLKADTQADQATPFLVGTATASSLLMGISSGVPFLYSPIGFNMRVLGPLGMLNFLNIASLNNILIKDGRCLEELNNVDTVIFDKTGTLTLEQPTVYNIITFGDYSIEDILLYAATAEQKLTHPIAKAILDMANKLGITALEIDDSKYEIGYGVHVRIGQQRVLVGSLRFMNTCNVKVHDSNFNDKYTQVFVALDDELMGILEIGSTIRPEAPEIIKRLKDRNLKIYILSGDNEKATKSLARELKIENYFAGVLPPDKGNIIHKLQEQGHKVCFVGDGINDAIALTKANVSVSLLGATSIATDCAQIVLMDKSLKHLDDVFELSKNFSQNQSVSSNIANIAGGIIIGSVLFFHIGVLTAVIISEGSLLVGIVNSMIPWIKFRNQQ